MKKSCKSGDKKEMPMDKSKKPTAQEKFYFSTGKKPTKTKSWSSQNKSKKK